MEDIVLNLNDILDCVLRILEVIGGSAVVASVFPKAPKLSEKGPAAIATVKKAINMGVVVYNTFITLANIGGFNFLKAKNKE